MVDLSLGKKCNNACIMCILPSKNLRNPSFEELCKFIDELYGKEDLRYIYLSGGEPTIRKDFFDIVDYIEKKYSNSEIRLITNGRMLVYEDFCDRLCKTKISKICTEIHASNAELHDRITQTPGSFQQTVDGIKNILEYPVNLEIRIVINKLNYRELPATAKFISDTFSNKIEAVMFPISIIGRALENKREVVATYTQIRPFVEKALDLFQHNKINAKIYHIPFCIISKKYWDKIPGKTSPEQKISFTKKCGKCLMKEKCPGLWKTYLFQIGDEEFSPIKL